MRPNNDVIAAGTSEDGPHESLAHNDLAGSEPWVPSVDESTQPNFDSSLREEVDRIMGPYNPLIAPTTPHEEGRTQDAYVAALKELTQGHRDTTTALTKHSQVLAECLRDFNEYKAVDGRVCSGAEHASMSKVVVRHANREEDEQSGLCMNIKDYYIVSRSLCLALVPVGYGLKHHHLALWRLRERLACNRSIHACK